MDGPTLKHDMAVAYCGECGYWSDVRVPTVLKQAKAAFLDQLERMMGDLKREYEGQKCPCCHEETIEFTYWDKDDYVPSEPYVPPSRGPRVERAARCDACGHEWTYYGVAFEANIVDMRGVPTQCPSCGDPDHLDF